MKKIPKKVMGLAGPIKVSMKDELVEPNGDESAGHWYGMKREIHVSADQTEREQWRSYYHELVHAALDDTGMNNLLTKEMQEAIADLIGIARMIEDGL